MRYRKH